MPQQRLRVWFTKGERVRYISHLDVLRFWERAIRRAELPLSYSQGFTPHPKIAFAGPLPLGFLAESELMDVTLDERVALPEFRARLDAQTTPDLAVVIVTEVALSAAPPQAALLWADYRVEFADVSPGAASDAVAAFLALDELPWTEERREKSRTYDLRAAVASLSAAASDGGCALTMRLRADQDLMARPEQLIEALFPGHDAARITRTGLVLNETSLAMDLWRKKGRFE